MPTRKRSTAAPTPAAPTPAAPILAAALPVDVATWVDAVASDGWGRSGADSSLRLPELPGVTPVFELVFDQGLGFRTLSYGVVSGGQKVALLFLPDLDPDARRRELSACCADAVFRFSSRGSAHGNSPFRSLLIGLMGQTRVSYQRQARGDVRVFAVTRRGLEELTSEGRVPYPAGRPFALRFGTPEERVHAALCDVYLRAVADWDLGDLGCRSEYGEASFGGGMAHATTVTDTVALSACEGAGAHAALGRLGFREGDAHAVSLDGEPAGTLLSFARTRSRAEILSPGRRRVVDDDLNDCDWKDLWLHARRCGRDAPDVRLSVVLRDGARRPVTSQTTPDPASPWGARHAQVWRRVEAELSVYLPEDTLVEHGNCGVGRGYRAGAYVFAFVWPRTAERQRQLLAWEGTSRVFTVSAPFSGVLS